jgi:hypothetical protein
MKNPRIEFLPSGRGKAQCPPDPDYPHGIEVDGAPPGVPSCTARLPYPAPECGMWIVHCDECPMTIAVTAAGRPDDPVSVRFPCPVGHRRN